MRSAPATVETMLSGVEFTLARCVKIVTREEDQWCFTDLDDDLEISGHGVVDGIYQAGIGLLAGDIDLTLGLEADNTEFKVPLSTSVTRTAVLGRRFNQADVWIFDADHSLDNPGPTELLYGKITEARVEGNAAVFEVRSSADLWNVTVGSILTPRCRADFGDAQCGMEKIDIPATITAVESTMRFTISVGASDYEDQYFRYGDVQFRSGPLRWVQPFEVQQSSAAGVIELIEPLPEPPQVGNQLYVRRGCSRLKRSDDPSLPTCHSYLNLAPNGGLRFRGFDRVPGSDTYLKMPIPGQG